MHGDTWSWVEGGWAHAEDGTDRRSESPAEVGEVGVNVLQRFH